MGLNAALVSLMTLDPTTQVFGRMLIAAIVIAAVLSYQQKTLRVAKQHLLSLVISGLLLMVHWVTFFIAIRVSNIPTATVVVATIPMFSALLEPIIHRKLPDGVDMLLGGIVVFGAAILIEDFSLESAAWLGVLLGLISALCKSLRDIMSRSLVKEYGSQLVTMYQLAVGTILIAPWFEPSTQPWDVHNILLLLFMGVFGTYVAHTLAISGLNIIKAVTGNLIGALTPLYQITFGILLLNDVPTMRVLIGGTIIISIATLETLRTDVT